MIQLNVDFTLLSKFFGISPIQACQYANKDIDEIMEIEAQKGNQKAADYKKILSDPDKILEIFKLANVENKFIILQNMSEKDLDNLLPYLNSDQLSLGLNFFTEEKLLQMCQELPMEELLAMVLDKFSLVDVLNLMTDDAMNKIIMEPDVDRSYAQKYFQSLHQDELEKIMVQVYGEEYQGKSSKEYLDELAGLNASDYKLFMTSLDRESKIGMIDGICKQKDELLLLFEPQDIVHPMELIMKSDKIEMMNKLDPEFLVPMIQELPIDLTQIVLTQIDPRDFSEILARDFENILSSVVLFSNMGV